MPKRAPIPLAITGAVYDRRNDVSSDDPTGYLEIGEGAVLGDLTESDLVRVRFTPGDVALYERLDTYGRMAVVGRHANYGYSGYFKASIFDGKRWRNLAIWHLLPANGHHYKAQGEKEAVQSRIAEAIARRAGEVVTYGHKAYRFDDEPARLGD